MNILVVEDELLVALVYQHFLGQKGITIDGPFTTGQEALDFIESNESSAAILDIQLDDNITGIQVAEKIRTNSNIPIIFTTGNDSVKTEKESSHIENSFVLPKPIDFKELLKIIDT